MSGIYKYKTIKKPVQIKVDTVGLSSDCNSIAFTNQGAANVQVHASRGSAYRLLEPGKSFSYVNDPNVMETTEFDITFTGAGSKDLLVEREYVTDISEP
jgi:hypothetical protein